MNFIKELFQKDIVKKLIVLIIIGCFFYFLKSMLNLFLLTFLFTYALYSLQKRIVKLLSRYIKIKPALVTLFLFLFLVFAIVFVIYRYIPLIFTQLAAIVTEISQFDFSFISDKFMNTYITPYLGNLDITSLLHTSGLSNMMNVEQFIKYAGNLGAFGFNLFISLMLSLFFVLEIDQIKSFLRGFENSSIHFVYKYTKDFGISFLNSFGKVIQSQIIIAFVNSILSTIGLFLLDFPQVLGLGVMVFFFSLIPVAGTIISLIPLCIIAYTVGGFKTILYVLILIAILHALESYVLNPRFMADKTDLPVFVVFITLIVSEHFMGVWGLLLGVPLLMFILDLLGVNPEELKKKNKLEKLLKKNEEKASN